MKKINTDSKENVEFHSFSILNMEHEYLSITGNDNWFIDEIGNLVYKINNEGKFSQMFSSFKMHIVYIFMNPNFNIPIFRQNICQK